MLNDGFRVNNYDALVAALNALSIPVSILGLAFVTNTVVGIATAVTGIYTSLSAAALSDELTPLIEKGTLQLDNMVDFMADHPEYDMVEFNIPWLAYVSTGNKEIRFCEATSSAGWAITAAHTGNGWQIFG